MKPSQKNVEGQIKKTIKASSIQSVNPEPTKENKNITQLQTKWVSFFKDTKNLYVNDLALRYRRSATTASLINAAVNYTVGSGFTYEINGEPVPEENLEDTFSKFLNRSNNDMQSLQDVYKDIVFNWKAFGNVYLEIVRVPVRGQETFAYSISVQDATKVRINKDQTKAYISSFWRDIQNSNTSGQYPKPVEVDLWNKNLETTQTRFIIHLKRKVPEYDYYGLPDYIATLKDADIEYHTDTYNLTRLENGFFPSAIVSLFGDPPEGMSDKAYIDALKNKYAGSSNSGEPLFQLLDDASQAAQVQEFSGSKEGEFTALEESAKKGMMQGHRIHPILADVETSGKLGSSTEVINHWHKYMKSVVIPEYQNPTLRLLNMVLGMLGFEVKLGVLNEPPVGYEDQIQVSSILDQNEQRELLGFEPKEVEQETETTETETEETEENGSDNGDSDSSGSGE